MYQDKFVVAIKANGKILREAKDLVHLPFGSEFSVLVKNLNSRRAKFKLDIDGQNVLDDTEIIVNANSEVEMKRFIRNGNMNEGNAFKFIERTAAIEDGPRGIKMDDGVVRVEFWFEKEAPEVKTVIHNHHDYWWDKHYYRTPPFGGPYYGGTYSSTASSGDVKLGSATKGIMRGMSASANVAQASNAAYTSNAATMDSFTPTSTEAKADVTVTNDVGITVPGSKVEQKFTTVYGFNAEAQSHVIVIRLAGRAGAINIVAPVTVKTKQKCTTCGHVNKANAKFCSECGTGLELV